MDFSPWGDRAASARVASLRLHASLELNPTALTELMCLDKPPGHEWHDKRHYREGDFVFAIRSCAEANDYRQTATPSR